VPLTPKTPGTGSENVWPVNITGFGRRSCIAAALAFVVALLVASPARADVEVYFLQGEQVTPVARPGASSADAARQLLAGPTDAERARGLRSYVPQSTTLRSATVNAGVATVDLSLSFVIEHDDPDSLRARVAQLIYTLTGPEGASSVRRHILRLAERSGDLGLVAAAQRLLDGVNTYDGSVWLQLFVDVDDACEGLGLDVGTRRTLG
jgi:hypothetical protein